MTAKGDNFQYALNTANTWLAEVCEEFGTDDRRFGTRVVRAWLHTLRDRLTVDSAVKFGAQLPELLRGMFYDGWEPSKVPIRYGVDDYVQRFGAQARITSSEVRPAASAVTRALGGRLSPGQLDEALAQVPEELRSLIGGSGEPAGPERARAAPEPTRARLDALEEQVSDLVEAVRTLARGLEGGPLPGTGNGPSARAARLATEILMTSPRS